MHGVLVDAGGRTEEHVRVERGPGGPVRFWRGQGRYEVGEVIEHRSETGGWRPGGPFQASVDRQVWRIEAVRAGRSRTSFAGVFDLSWEPAQDRWLLVRVHD